MSIRSFKNRATEDIANGERNKRTLKVLPANLHYVAYKKLIFLDNIETIDSLIAWPGLKFEKLKGDRKGLMSIRINDQYRICFRFFNGESWEVEIVDYHS